MAERNKQGAALPAGKSKASKKRKTVYDAWMESIGVPIYRGHHVEDLRRAELGWWEERQAFTAFLALQGMHGVSEARVMEIPPGGTPPPLKLAIGEMVYVLRGSGLAAIWNENGGERQTVEWGERSLF